jgi:hypothetical protein
VRYPSKKKHRGFWTDVEIEFTTEHKIPKSGSIEIEFPSEVPKVHQNCRSAVTKGSELKSKEAGGGRSCGTVTCKVQNTRRWVITDFEE